MPILRVVFLAACLACPLLAMGNCRWQGQLTLDHHTWIIDLGRAPIWSPPTMPPYSKFKDTFKDSVTPPPDDSARLTIKREVDLESPRIEFLPSLWTLTLP